MSITLRTATLDDREAIERLIALSARGLSRDDYSDAQIEAAIAAVFGVDTELIHDGSYFVVEQNGELVGCGGWSKRKTLFGGDRFAGRESGLLDPTRDAAKIRAFFVHPGWARRGIGRLLLQTCEAAAREHGFQSLELMATLPGVKLYQALGFQGSERVTYQAEDVAIDFVPMRKDLGIAAPKPSAEHPAV
jgi:GNAT superfamily N-acetyltransferase